MHRLEDIYMRGRHWPRTIRHEGHWSVRSYVVHLYYIVVHQPDAYIRQVHLYYREREGERERERGRGRNNMVGLVCLVCLVCLVRAKPCIIGAKSFILG